MREDRALSVRLSCEEGKLGLVELNGADSTNWERAPENVKESFEFEKNLKVVKFNRVKQDSYCFCYRGRVNDKECVFRIDTGFDVSILNRKFVVIDERKKFGQEEFNLRYPTGEMVPIKSKIFVEIRVGQYLREFPVFIAEISDDCILGVDFLRDLKLENIFDQIFSPKEENIENIMECRRMEKNSF